MRRRQFKIDSRGRQLQRWITFRGRAPLRVIKANIISILKRKVGVRHD